MARMASAGEEGEAAGWLDLSALRAIVIDEVDLYLYTNIYYVYTYIHSYIHSYTPTTASTLCRRTR